MNWEGAVIDPPIRKHYVCVAGENNSHSRQLGRRWLYKNNGPFCEKISPKTQVPTRLFMSPLVGRIYLLGLGYLDRLIFQLLVDYLFTL